MGGTRTIDSRCRDVVQDQKQAVRLEIALPVVARAHGGVDLVIDHALPIKIGDDELRTTPRQQHDMAACN